MLKLVALGLEFARSHLKKVLVVRLNYYMRETTSIVDGIVGDGDLGQAFQISQAISFLKEKKVLFCSL